MRPQDFSALVCDMPALKNPVPRNTPGVEILSGSGAFLLLAERRNAAMDAGHATYGMMACEARGWQEVEDNMEKMRREKRMGEVLRVHILALRSGGSCTANRTGRT